MSGPLNDYLDGLSHQIKEEVVNRYLRERLSLKRRSRSTAEPGGLPELEASVRDRRDDWPVCWPAGEFRGLFPAARF
jgi:hypothetical protein